jgi:hypothetical protein
MDTREKTVYLGNPLEDEMPVSSNAGTPIADAIEDATQAEFDESAAQTTSSEDTDETAPAGDSAE